MAATSRLIVNPTSGGGRSARILPKVVELMQAADQDFHTIFTRSLKHAEDLAREAVDKGHTVVPMGGDGLVSAVCSAVANHTASSGTEAVVAVMPAGRGNDFAHFFGIDSVATAVDLIAHGEARKIDLGRINDRLFLSVACLGLDSDVLTLSDRVKLVKGKSVYAYAAVRSLLAWKQAEFALTLTKQDDSIEQISTKGFNVVVANTAFYGGGMKIAPGASVFDGQFQVVSVGDMSKRSLLTNLPKVFRGTHGSVDGVDFWDAKAIEISTDRPIDVFIDGERAATTPVRMEVVPAALSLMLPPLTRS